MPGTTGSRSSRLQRALVSMQIFLLIASLFAPVMALAVEPSADPSGDTPSGEPSEPPSAEPTAEPTAAPTEEPTATPAEEPTATPAEEPTERPTEGPSATPTQPATSPSPTSGPTVTTDLEDYPPGGLVILDGDGWASGERVHLYVNDDDGSTWNRNVDLVADASGRIHDEFSLPNWFVANYRVIATGETSGVAIDTFTDSNPQTITVAVPTSVTIAQGGTAAFGNVSLTVGGNSNPCTVTFGVTPALPSGATVVFGSSPQTTTGANLTTSLSVTTSASTPAGTYTFQVTGSNGAGCQGPGAAPSNTLTLIVSATNTAPTASAVSLSTNEDQAVVVTLTATDAGTCNLTFAASSPINGALGSVTSNPCASGTPNSDTATVTFTPTANFNGPASFTYTASDGSLTSSTATVTIAVRPSNDAPTSSNGSATVAEDGSTNIDLGALVADIETSDADLTYTIESAPSNGGLTGSGPSRTYTPEPDFNGTDSLTYSVTDRGDPDGCGAPVANVCAAPLTSTIRTISITVTAGNDAPTVSLAAGNTVSLDEGTQHAYAFTVSDVDGADTFTVVSASCGANGTQVGSTTTTPTGGSFVCSFPDGPASSTVSIQVKDSDDALSTTASQVVTIANVAPTVTLTGEAAADEGQTTTYSFTVDDPGDDTFVLDDTSCGTSGSQVGSDTFDDVTGTGSFDCSFPDGPVSPTVTATVRDSDGAADADSIGVTVANAKPTIVLSGSATADEGETNTYSFTVADPGQDTHTITTACGANGAKVGGSDAYDAGSGAGSFACFFADGPATTDVTATVTDSDGASDTDNQVVVVTVDNVAPTVTLSAINDLSVDEGDTRTYAFTTSDPGEDAFSLVGVSCGASGLQVGTAAFDTTTGGGSFVCSFPDGPASSTISVQVKDSDAAPSDTATQIVSIANVKPTVTLTGDTSADEGSTRTYTYTVTDPGDDALTITESCGTDGVLTDTLAATSFECTFPDGPASSTVLVTADDGDPAPAASDSIEVTIANVAPTVTLASGNDLSVDEGTQHTYAFTVTDPGADSFTVVSASCGANGTQVGSTTTTPTGGSFVCSFPDGPASSTVSIQVKDSDDALSTTASQVVTIANVAPTVTLTGEETVSEGSTHTYTYSVTDPGDDEFTIDATFPKCGLSGALVSGSLTQTAAGGTFQCTFPDGPASTTLAIKVTDTDGASGTDSEAIKVVAVVNVDPVVTAPADQTADEGASATFDLGSFTDPGADSPWAVAVDWGDGSTATSFSTTATGSLGTASHSYADGPKTHTVTVTVTDKNGGVGSATFEVTIANVAPTVTLASGNDLSVDEGTQHTYAFTVTDPGADSFTVVSASCGANGTQVGSTTTTPTGGSFVCSFPDGPASSTVSIQVKDSDDALSTTASQVVTIANVAPTVAVSGAATTDEGATYSLTLGPVTDPGTDTVTSYIVHWGDGATDIYSSAGIKTHVYADGPDTHDITVDLIDDDGLHAPAGSASIDVLNVAPVVVLSGDSTDVDEGTTRTYTYTATDAGNDPLTITESCGANATRTNTPALNSFDCTFSDGPASTTVSVTANDGDPTNDTGDDSTSLVINNVAPSVPTVSITFDPFTHLAIATATYADPGMDTHTASFVWSVGGATPVTKSATDGVVADGRSLPNGCFTLTVAVTITDSDGASGTRTGTYSGSADAYVVGFEAPIKDNERNIAKYGNVVPIKVRITSSCSGTAITNQPLFITIADGNVGDVEPDATPVIVADSVSNADAGTQMRVNGTGYMYNFATKTLTQGKDYTIRIRLGSTTGSIIARALFQPKK